MNEHEVQQYAETESRDWEAEALRLRYLLNDIWGVVTAQGEPYLRVHSAIRQIQQILADQFDGSQDAEA